MNIYSLSAVRAVREVIRFCLLALIIAEPFSFSVVCTFELHPCNVSLPYNKCINHEHVRLCIFVSDNDLDLLFNNEVKAEGQPHSSDLGLGRDSESRSRALEASSLPNMDVLV